LLSETGIIELIKRMKHMELLNSKLYTIDCLLTNRMLEIGFENLILKQLVSDTIYKKIFTLKGFPSCKNPGS
jgi:hypothetical protein